MALNKILLFLYFKYSNILSIIFEEKLIKINLIKLIIY